MSACLPVLGYSGFLRWCLSYLISPRPYGPYYKFKPTSRITSTVTYIKRDVSNYHSQLILPLATHLLPNGPATHHLASSRYRQFIKVHHPRHSVSMHCLRTVKAQ
ncbi:hypothetical protein IWW34DRAFT_745904 [Fusarium oxysporum f. sp. albedinis]|nr:hypothetical protein IWW34DRAFT_745904 [Fusarium oxysporum f. sp. albedinis]KAJ0132575.1 Uncharacterized protein HZ326_24339 [Fusarium oxysporum f. sp. albedinis]